MHNTPFSASPSAAPATVRPWREIPCVAGKPFELRAVQGEQVTVVEARPRAGDGLPEHAHPQEQISVILSGSVRFASDGEERLVGAGEVIYIPGGVRHGAIAVDDAIVIEVFAPRLEFAG